MLPECDIGRQLAVADAAGIRIFGRGGRPPDAPTIPVVAGAAGGAAHMCGTRKGGELPILPEYEILPRRSRRARRATAGATARMVGKRGELPILPEFEIVRGGGCRFCRNSRFCMEDAEGRRKRGELPILPEFAFSGEAGVRRTPLRDGGG